MKIKDGEGNVTEQSAGRWPGLNEWEKKKAGTWKWTRGGPAHSPRFWFDHLSRLGESLCEVSLTMELAQVKRFEA